MARYQQQRRNATLLRRRRLRSRSQPSPLLKRDSSITEGQAGSADGVVLSMTLLGDGMEEIAYAVTATVGGQSFQLEIDTGSSDMWLASTSCSSQPCSDVQSSLYDDSNSKQTGATVSLQYLSGNVSGPVVWDEVIFGGFEIDNQALIAASEVASEDLSSGFTGLIGLAFEDESKIAAVLPPVIGNAPDGAPLWSNIFGTVQNLTRFFSVSLERPGLSEIPSLFGIGRHPSSLVPNPDKVKYDYVVPGESASNFWRVELQNVTAYVNGTPHNIPVKSRAVTFSAIPIAAVDTGGPVIVAPTDFANALYGAWGIGPAADGNYYMPCTTMLNMSVTIANTEFAIHPLDLAFQPDPDANSCQGTILADDVLAQPGAPGDVILGVPFLRNVYTVFSFAGVLDQPGAINTAGDETITPRLGLLSLTNSSLAVEQWQRARLDGLSPDVGDPSAAASSSNATSASGQNLSVGVEVLLAVIGFFIGCGILFSIGWLCMRRQWKRDNREQRSHDEKVVVGIGMDGQALYPSLGRYSERSDVITLNTLYSKSKGRPDTGTSYSQDSTLALSSSRSQSRGLDGDYDDWGRRESSHSEAVFTHRSAESNGGTLVMELHPDSLGSHRPNTSSSWEPTNDRAVASVDAGPTDALLPPSAPAEWPAVDSQEQYAYHARPTHAPRSASFSNAAYMSSPLHRVVELLSEEGSGSGSAGHDR